MSALRFTIGELASRTGLTTHTIRAWEKRYGAITPERTDSNQRLYDSSQLERLQLLRRATGGNHSISRVAKLSDEELGSLFPISKLSSSSVNQVRDSDLLQDSLSAIQRLDEEALNQCLKRSLVMSGVEGALDTLLLPLLTEIGKGWQSGEIRIYQEHMATSVIRTFLADLLGSINPQVESPRMVVTTPKNQHHEIGALLAAIGCASQQWNVVYLGANLPSKEIADAFNRSHAKAISLSIVFPLDDGDLPAELLSLRKLVGDTTPIMVGGSGVLSYEPILSEIHAKTFSDWKGLSLALASLNE